MPALPDLQEDFLDSVLRDQSAILQRIRPDGKITPEQRMQIYRKNTFFILTDVLKAAFPATASLGSEEFFRFLAREFIKAHPPQSGDMNGYGAELPSFMRKSGLVKDYPFLADVAELEWLRQESYMAPDKSSAPLHPSLRLFSSPHPIIQLWKLGKGQIAVEKLALNGSGENAIIFRRDDGVEMWSVNADIFDFIKALAHGTEFNMPAEFDPGIHIQSLNEAGLIQR